MFIIKKLIIYVMVLGMQVGDMSPGLSVKREPPGMYIWLLSFTHLSSYTVKLRLLQLGKPSLLNVGHMWKLDGFMSVYRIFLTRALEYLFDRGIRIQISVASVSSCKLHFLLRGFPSELVQLMDMFPLVAVLCNELYHLSYIALSES